MGRRRKQHPSLAEIDTYRIVENLSWRELVNRINSSVGGNPILWRTLYMAVRNRGALPRTIHKVEAFLKGVIVHALRP